MFRRLSILYGLAILAVVIGHSAGWGITAMFWWAHRYRPVTSPNFDQFGTFPYYIIIILQQLSYFSVPAFIFCSGFFVSYTARGTNAKLTWNTILTRLRNLLIPYLIWSVAIFTTNYFRGIKFQPIEYLRMLLFGQTIPPYYFIPLLCQLYLLSPFIIAIVKRRPRLILFLAGLFQFTVIILRYNTFLKFLLMGGNPVSFPDWFFGGWIFFFILGVVAGLFISEFKLWITQMKWVFLIILFIFSGLQIIESDYFYRFLGVNERGPEALTSNIYALSFLLVFFAFENLKIPFSKHLDQLGKYSYGIYLIHYLILGLVAKTIYHLAPLILAREFIFQTLLITPAIAIPLSLMAILGKSRGRIYYHYLFG